MSVRAGLLAILHLGPAYGLQLRNEFLDRAPHRSSINVGQVYGTLDRLMSAGLVRSAGLTTDGSPLYGLTEAGADEARTWMRRAETNAGERIDDLLDHVLIVSSLPGVDAAVLLAEYRAQLMAGDDAGDEGSEARPTATPQAWAAAAARQRIRHALVDWLDEFGECMASGSAPMTRPLRDERPARGRRPGTTGS